MFCQYFEDKLEFMHSSFSDSMQFILLKQLRSASPASLMSVSIALRRWMMSKSQTTSCSLDPMPIFLVKDCAEILAPSITKLVNLCLSQDMIPDSFKQTIVKPIIKKQTHSKHDPKH